MPFYAVATKGSWSPSVAEAVAQAITLAHTEETNAPSRLVNVLVQYGCRLRAGEQINVSGTVRAGEQRTSTLLRRLQDRLRADIAQAAGAPEGAVAVSLAKVQPKWVMEAGLILPEPGTPEEEGWKAAVAALAD